MANAQVCLSYPPAWALVFLYDIINTMTMSIPEAFGNAPAIVKWNIVRGDTARLRVDFLQNDEVTPFDIGDWSFGSTTYDVFGDILDTLTVEPGNGYVTIIAPASITAEWGTGYGGTVAELAFDLQVELQNNIVWTPVLGTIKVSADVTGGSL